MNYTLSISIRKNNKKKIINRLLNVSSLLVLIFLFFYLSNFFLVSSEIVVPKLILNKHIVDYCSSSEKEKEFILTLDLGEIFSKDLLYDVDLVIAYDKKKVVILSPLLIGTLSEQFQATTNAIWDNLSYEYNYYNFQGYKLSPVYGKKPLINFLGKLLVDSIDSTDFSIGYINLSEEFAREYLQSKEDTVKIYSMPESASKKIMALEIDAGTTNIQNSEIEFGDDENIVEVPYNLQVENYKHLEKFKIEFDITTESGDNLGTRNYEISNFTLNNEFKYSAIEFSNNKLLLEIGLADKIYNGYIKEFIKIEVTKKNRDTSVSALESSIFDVNNEACSKFIKLPQAIKLKTKYNPDTTGIINDQENNRINNIDFNYDGNTLLISASQQIKKIRILDILGRSIYHFDEKNLADAKYIVKKQVNLVKNNIYFLEILQGNNIVRRKMIIS